ncbi:MAG: TetR/AcrR family transcriptional regulator [Roseburia sp.]
MKNISENSKLNRAQKYFIEALLSLMEKKAYQDITVQELSEAAQYDRRTYYRYFTCKEDILRLYCAHILNEMALMMTEKGPLSLQSGVMAYFSFWEQYTDFLRLLGRNDLLHFMAAQHDELLYEYVGKSVQPDIPDNLGNAQPLSRYSFYFTSGGLWNTLVHWVNEEPSRTPEELTDYILMTFQMIGRF